MKTFFKWDEPSRFDVRRERDLEVIAHQRLVFRLVDQRDGRACRCCDQRSDPEAVGLLTRGHRHHLIFESAGGGTVTTNLVTLCARCHNDVHQHRLSIDGNPDEALIFFRRDGDGEWYVIRRELAVRVVERD